MTRRGALIIAVVVPVLCGLACVLAWGEAGSGPLAAIVMPLVGDGPSNGGLAYARLTSRLSPAIFGLVLGGCLLAVLVTGVCLASQDAWRLAVLVACGLVTTGASASFALLATGKPRTFAVVGAYLHAVACGVFTATWWAPRQELTLGVVVLLSIAVVAIMTAFSAVMSGALPAGVRAVLPAWPRAGARIIVGYSFRRLRRTRRRPAAVGVPDDVSQLPVGCRENGCGTSRVTS